MEILKRRTERRMARAAARAAERGLVLCRLADLPAGTMFVMPDGHTTYWVGCWFNSSWREYAPAADEGSVRTMALGRRVLARAEDVGALP